MRCAKLSLTVLLLGLTHIASARDSLELLHDAIAAIEPQVIEWRGCLDATKTPFQLCRLSAMVVVCARRFCRRPDVT